ncbi:AAA family ATPase [Capnocytophaga felis]|uniref:Chromosome segregation protein SMC n=1 Tax=Capnocytophaga felis TaxID=2267611 RepID=A0A5M4B8G6_9FLAO|nr:AAA family ATPase [Capnocytophaga felis]GET45893.1 chromosome segregation protein SMC [Capnocytophaga felis]GET49254.1 chromosome segregation protein SMC [Capnocytophaga felis]
MKRITIKGYKSIRELSLTMQNINIFIGANGSGKSNFLSFFDFLKQIYRRNLREYVALKGIDTFLHKGDKITQEISAKLEFENTNAYSFTLKKGDDSFIFTEEGLWYDNIHFINPIDIASFNTESNLYYNNAPRARYIENYISGLKKYHFHDTGEHSPFGKASNVENDKYFLYEKGENLAAFLFDIQHKHPVSYQFIVKTVQSIASYFFDFFLKPESNGSIRLKWRSKYADTVYGVNDLSDGTIRFIALATLFLQPQLPEVIIIDEPELGLHPTAIAKLSGLIKSVAKKDVQVIIATQSTDLISHFEPEDVITVDQIDGESHFQRLKSEELQVWLEDYTLDDLWKRNIITKGQPNF